MKWTDNPVFQPKYAERMRMGNVTAIPTPLMAASLAKVFQQLEDMGVQRAMDVRIPKRLTPAERKTIRAKLRKDLQRSIEMLEGRS